MITLKTLQNQDGYTFEEGVAVLVMCGTAPGVVQHIQRTHNRGYLNCELAKLLRTPGMAHRIRMKYPDQDEAVAKTEVAEGKAPEIATPESEPKSAEPEVKTEVAEEKAPEIATPESEPKSAEPEVKTEVAEEKAPEIATPESEPKAAEPEVKTMLDVRSDRATRFEDMPTEKARELWLKKQDKYRLMQQKHLQMRKVAKGEKHNEQRAKLRAEVVKLDGEIDKLWKQIDEEVALHG